MCGALATAIDSLRSLNFFFSWAIAAVYAALIPQGWRVWGFFKFSILVHFVHYSSVSLLILSFFSWL